MSSQYFPVQFNKGEHGYDNQEMDMKVFFRAVGPAFRKNLEVGHFETVNIYPLMCHILQIEPEPNDGHLDLTEHMLAADSRAAKGEWGPSITSAAFRSDLQIRLSYFILHYLPTLLSGLSNRAHFLLNK